MSLIKKLPALIRDSRLFSIKSSEMIKPIVTVQEGTLCGAVNKLYDGSDYYSFKGIPYAQPPIGKLRFKAPIPIKAWEGILDATEHGGRCPQTSETREIIEGDENCLFLNVYTPILKSDSKLPVMVYIHGGGFLRGSGNDDMYGPQFLLSQNVILVTINYRLEAFGFLCLDTPEVPGNAGLKDQVTALRWVQQNIDQFGGDSENVTIFGESAGGASVTYHMLSPMSKELFSKAISQSGVCLNDWAIDIDAKARAFRVGRILGKDTDNTDDLLEFLQSVPSKELIAINFKVRSEYEKCKGLTLHFGPVVERKFNNTEAFITEKPLDLLLSGKFRQVPLMLGYNSREGIIMARSELKKVDFTNKYPSFLVPKEIAQKLSEEKLREYGERIKQFYSGGRDLNTEDVDIVSDMQTDLHIMIGIFRLADIYSAWCKSIYVYRFNLCTELNMIKPALGLSQYKGVTHAEELYYIFHNSMNIKLYTKKENLRHFVNIITKIWTDFAKKGNPTPDDTLDIKWAPYTSRNKEYLSIDHKMSMKEKPDQERLEFWLKIYNEAGLQTNVRSNKSLQMSQ